jgi:zinc protease
VFGVYGSPRDVGSLDAVERAVDAEVARIVADGVTPDELEAAKNRYLRSMIFASDNQSRMANLYGSTLAVGGTVKDVQEWPQRIRAVTSDEVRRVAVKYLSGTRSVTAYLLPAQAAAN